MSFLRRNYLLRVIFFFLVLLFFCSKFAFAATVILNPAKDKLSASEELPVDVSLEIAAADGTVYYLRGVFYKSGTSSYCGFTWNGNGWFSGPYSSSEGWKNFFPITVNNNSWQGQLKVKIDPENSSCRDSGSYIFKVERFTQGGSGAFDSQDIKTVEVVIPTLSLTPVPIPTSTKTPTPTKTLTPTKTPTFVSSAKSTAASTTKPTPTVNKQVVFAASTVLISPVRISPARAGESRSLNQQNGSSIEAVLAENITNVSTTPTLDITADPKKNMKNETKSKNYIPIILISTGVIFIAACGIIALRSYKKGKKTSNGDF